MKKHIYTLLIALFIIVIAISSFNILKISNEYEKGEKLYSEIIHLSKSQESKSEDNKTTIIDFTSLEKINPDIVAWLKIDDTNINYPVVQTTDNEYYLNHLFDKQINSSGCVFMDYRNNDFSDLNTIIYGHNMKNDSMFGQLKDFKNQEFFDKHKTGILITKNKQYKIKFISGFIAKPSDSIWQTTFDMQYINEVVSKSYFKSDTVPTSSDKFITLATCSYEFDNARFILVGITEN